MTERTLEQRFWAKVERRGPRECWPWKAGRSREGYGTFYEPPTRSAHRLAWRSTYGPVPPGHFICHSCNNRLCCNPAHLYPATQHENMQYAVRIGHRRSDYTLQSGEAHYGSKLTEGIVRWIRFVYTPRHPTFGGKALAQRYGVAGATISKIARGDTWKRTATKGRKP